MKKPSDMTAEERYEILSVAFALYVMRKEICEQPEAEVVMATWSALAQVAIENGVCPRKNHGAIQ